MFLVSHAKDSISKGPSVSRYPVSQDLCFGREGFIEGSAFDVNLAGAFWASTGQLRLQHAKHVPNPV